MQPFNKYYPPDWEPEKGSVNKFVGKHPLGDRARKIDQGILIVRFELPYNIWCEGCGKHVGKGVRYNAEKKKVGNYYSTPIYSFRMRCHLCDNWIEIQTDPKNSEYVVVSGARQKVETWEPEDTETIRLKDDKEAEKLIDDAIYKLEQSKLNDRQWADPYTHSQRMRKLFREEKKEFEAKRKADEEIRKRNSLSITLLPESNDDIIKAKTTEFADHLLEKAVKRKLEISTSSIFNKNNKKLISSSSLSSKSKKYKSIFDNSNSKVAQLSAVVTKKDNKKSSNNNNIEEKSKTVENQQQQQIDNSNNMKSTTISLNGLPAL
nr:5062_t:CDS:10 [Entrophospora candida]